MGRVYPRSSMIRIVRRPGGGRGAEVGMIRANVGIRVVVYPRCMVLMMRVARGDGDDE